MQIKIFLASFYFVCFMEHSANAQTAASQFAQHKQPALFSAIEQNKPQTVRDLIARGDDINIMSRSGETPLLLAIAHQNPQLITLLIEAGAILNIPNKQGVTPLLKAIEKKNMALVKALVKAGAEVDLVSQTGIKPTFKALQGQQLEILKYLLNKGATFDEPNYVVGPAIQYKVVSLALEQPSIQMLDYLFKKKAIPLSSVNKELILNKIIAKDDVNIIRFLLQQGFNFDSEHVVNAIFDKRFEILSLMIAKGGLKKKTFPMRSVLSALIDNDNTSSLDYLMQHTEVRAFLQKNKQDMLMTAVFRSKRKRVLFLKDQGADLNFENTKAETPLSIAVKNRHFDMVKLLLDQKNALWMPVVNSNAKNRKGKTVFDIPTSAEIKSLLKEYDSKSR